MQHHELNQVFARPNQTKGNHQRTINNVLSITTAFLVIGSCGLWWLQNWYFFPVWFPLPGATIMGFLNFLEPIIFPVIGSPLALIYFGICLIQISRLIQLLLHRQVFHVTRSGLIVLVLAALPVSWWVAPIINQKLFERALTQYNQAVEAIHHYKQDNGHYPASLNELVPAYLSAVPTINMKFGERLNYEPAPSAWYDYSPFVFELYGHRGVHGQTLKYCPITVDPCYETDRHFSYQRITDMWIWLYSSAL